MTVLAQVGLANSKLKTGPLPTQPWPACSNLMQGNVEQQSPLAIQADLELLLHTFLDEADGGVCRLLLHCLLHSLPDSTQLCFSNCLPAQLHPPLVEFEAQFAWSSGRVMCNQHHHHLRWQLAGVDAVPMARVYTLALARALACALLPMARVYSLALDCALVLMPRVYTLTLAGAPLPMAMVYAWACVIVYCSSVLYANV